MRPLLCVRYQASAPLGVIEEVLRQEEIEWRYLDAWREEPPSTTEISGLIVLGGEMNVDDVANHPYLRPVRALVGEAIEAQMPVLGVCLGGQTIARALGAEVRRAAEPEIGFHPVVPTEEGGNDPVLAPFDGSFPVFQWHEDGFDLPAGATLLHASAGGGNQSFRVGDSVYATQFHLEVTEDIIDSWIDETDPERLGSYWGTTRDELMSEAREHLHIQQETARTASKSFLELLRA